MEPQVGEDYEQVPHKRLRRMPLRKARPTHRQANEYRDENGYLYEKNECGAITDIKKAETRSTSMNNYDYNVCRLHYTLSVEDHVSRYYNIIGLFENGLGAAPFCLGYTPS